jgi:hypothetical protein
MLKLKRETVRVPAVSGASHEPLAETVRPPPAVRPSLEGKVAVRVSKESAPISQICVDEGEGSGGMDYPAFFNGPGIKADILVIADVQVLWDDANMHRFVVSLEVFRRANPASAVIVDASASPLFKGLISLHEEGKINAIIDSPPGGGRAIELGLEVLSVLR